MLLMKEHAGMRYRTRLAELLKAKGKTRMDIVRNAGLSYPTVVSWEKDALKSLDADKVQAVMDELGCTYDELVYRTDETGKSA